jgi:hypothetical protein
MSTTGAGGGGGRAGGGAEQPGWSEADEALRGRIIRDEIRLARDEERIAEEERGIRRNWRLALALAGLLVLTVTALILSVVALNRDIDEVAAAAPREDSIGASALQDGAVTADALATGSVTPAALADGAVRSRAVADGAITGADIEESTLGRVPSAARADSAADATALGGVAAARHLSRTVVATNRSATSTLAVKGPLSAICPAGTRVVSGGASIDGAARVAITTSAPDGEGGWVARAAAMGTPSGPWRLEVVALCARGG